MFELHITCTKDITNLNLNFVDGTSVISDNNTVTSNSKDEQIVSFEDNSNIKREVIKAPKIPDIPDRPVKVDNILDGLEI